MEIYSSDDELDRSSERFGSYSLSADVSESESSGSFSHRQCDHEAGTSSALASSPIPRPAFAASSIPTARMNVNFPVTGGTNVVVPVTKTENPEIELSEVELMKERFAKLLLGEDMSGGSKGVCTAFAVSNAITNLSAAVFGEVWKLEPLPPQKKSMWRREMDWLLCVSDSIVELIPSLQEFPEGGTFEVMVTRPRSDLYVNLPALKKLDAMLLGILDGFHDSEFYYCDRGIIVPSDSERLILSSSSSTGTPSIRPEGKWWLPFPKVPSNGLSDDATKRLQQCRECTNQILKAALAINGNVLAEMEIPNVYLQNLPKSGKACLGEIVYHYMTAGKFSPECLLDYLDLSSEYTTLEIANRVEAAVHIWKQKCLKRHPTLSKSGKTSWSEKVKGLASDLERNRLLANRAETLLRNLKMRFPGLPQTTLDMTKIQYNKDVGQSILESYSRVLESLAFNIMARIDDLLYINDATKRRAAFADSICLNDHGRFGSTSLPKQKRMSRSPSSVQHASSASRIKATPLHPRIPIGGHGSPSERTHRLVKRTTTSETEEEKFKTFSNDSK